MFSKPARLARHNISMDVERLHRGTDMNVRANWMFPKSVQISEATITTDEGECIGEPLLGILNSCIDLRWRNPNRRPTGVRLSL